MKQKIEYNIINKTPLVEKLLKLESENKEFDKSSAKFESWSSIFKECLFEGSIQKVINEAMFAQGFKEDLEECIYLFPELTEEDKEELHNYDLAYLGKNHFMGEISDVVKGSKEDLIRYGKEYLDYILHPDYLYKEEDFAGEIVNEKLERNEISDFFDKAKRLGVENLGQLKDLLAQEESKGNTEKEKIDAYADSVELSNDTLSNESLDENLKIGSEVKIIGNHEKAGKIGKVASYKDGYYNILFKNGNNAYAKIDNLEFKKEDNITEALKEAFNDIEEVKRKLDLFPKQITVNKELKNDLIDLLRSKNISFMIDDHMTIDGRIGDRLTFILKYPKHESLKEDLNKESLEQEIRKAIREHFRTWDDEDYEDMIGEYLVVEVEDQEDGRTKVEVRAELSYATLDNIADELNKVIQKYDKDAYFDHENAGIINAFIDKNAEGKAIDEYDASKDEKLQGVRLRDYRNKWSAIDHMEVNGVDYYMFENDTYGDETYYVVTSDINEGPFYETFDDIETCLRDEGVLEENLNEGLNKNTIKKEVKEWAKDDYKNGTVLDTDDTDEFEKLLLDNYPDLENHKDMPDLIYELKDLYFDTVDDLRSGDYDELDEKLIQGKSDATLKKNIKTEIEAGKDPKQAYAIAKSIQKKNESFEDEHLGEIVDFDDEEYIDYESNVKEDNLFDEAIEAGQVEKAKEIEKEIQWHEEKEDDQPYNKDSHQAEISELKKELKEEAVDLFDNTVHEEDIVDDIDISDSDIEKISKLAMQEHLKNTKSVNNNLIENKQEVNTQAIINESINSEEDVVMDYVSPNAVDPNMKPVEVDLNNI